MNITSKSIEGKKWETQYKKLATRFYVLMKIMKNAKKNFGLEVCPRCENLKKPNERCPECGNA